MSFKHFFGMIVLNLQWEPNVEKALKDGKLNPEQKSALTRQLCTSITAQHSGSVTAAERNQIAILLIQQWSLDQVM
jgi:hypothetical protein